MKAVGYTYCAVCHALNRGYQPRGWEPGNELAIWAHGPAGVYGRGRSKCDGSYKPGVDSRLDQELKTGRH